MSVLKVASKAGKNYRTVILTAAEQDGLLKTTEVEPYVYRYIDGCELLYCYDTNENSTKIFNALNIISIEETENSFNPRYPVVI